MGSQAGMERRFAPPPPYCRVPGGPRSPDRVAACHGTKGEGQGGVLPQGRRMEEGGGMRYSDHGRSGASARPPCPSPQTHVRGGGPRGSPEGGQRGINPPVVMPLRQTHYGSRPRPTRIVMTVMDLGGLMHPIGGPDGRPRPRKSFFLSSSSKSLQSSPSTQPVPDTGLWRNDFFDWVVTVIIDAQSCPSSSIPSLSSASGHSIGWRSHFSNPALHSPSDGKSLTPWPSFSISLLLSI